MTNKVDSLINVSSAYQPSSISHRYWLHSLSPHRCGFYLSSSTAVVSELAGVHCSQLCTDELVTAQRQAVSSLLSSIFNNLAMNSVKTFASRSRPRPGPRHPVTRLRPRPLKATAIKFGVMMIMMPVPQKPTLTPGETWNFKLFKIQDGGRS